MSLVGPHVVQTLFLPYIIHRPYAPLGLARITAPLSNRWPNPVPFQGTYATFATIHCAKDVDLNTMHKNKHFEGNVYSK